MLNKDSKVNNKCIKNFNFYCDIFLFKDDNLICCIFLIKKLTIKQINKLFIKNQR